MTIFAVIDNKVFVGACLGQGTAAQVVQACLTGSAHPLMGAASLAEYEDVLARGALMAGSRLSAAERSELLDILIACFDWTRVYLTWRPNLPDEAENHLIELGAAGAVAFIVTRNLRDMSRAVLTFPGLRCMAPAPFLKEIAS